MNNMISAIVSILVYGILVYGILLCIMFGAPAFLRRFASRILGYPEWYVRLPNGLQTPRSSYKEAKNAIALYRFQDGSDKRDYEIVWVFDHWSSK